MNELPPNARLYLPNRLFVGHQRSLHALHSPVPPGHPSLPVFPFQIPENLGVPGANLLLHQLGEAEYTTSDRATTATATQIQQLQGTNQALRHIRACSTFWENLRRYARRPTAQDLAEPARSTWTLPGTPLPHMLQQIEGVKALAAWYISHINRGPIIPEMNSEQSVQGEILIQVMEPMNGLLKTRYSPVNNDPAHLAYPRWGRPCDALHATPGVRGNAGFPDFLLIRSSTLNDYGAVGEVKTWWSYETDDFMNLFEAAVSPQGTLMQVSSNTMVKLLKQVWGELHFFNSHLGFCTNGEVVMFFAKSGANTLVLSSPKRLAERGVFEAFAGLNFAAVDIRPGNAILMIDTILCPMNQRGLRWT